MPNPILYDLSIVIVNYNTRDVTAACVDSILRDQADLKIEVIIVDNLSSDDSISYLRDTYPSITVIESPVNGGFGYGNNIGFRQCQGEYILALNSDTEVSVAQLERAIDYMRKHPDVGILGPKMVYNDGSWQNSTLRHISLTTLFWLIFLPAPMVVYNRFMGDHRYGRIKQDQVQSVEAVMGSFMLMPRSIIEKTSGFDMRFFMYSEEAELAYRVQKLNKKIIYYPYITIMHHSGYSTKGMSEWQAVEMARSYILFLRITRNPLIAWVGTAYMLIKDIFRLPYYQLVKIIRPKNSNKYKPGLARLKFLLSAIFKQPKGQNISLPEDI